MPLKKLTPYFLYLGIGLFVALLALTLVSIRQDWQARVQSGKARALYELVRNSIPNRPTDTPGAIAWLNGELQRYLDRADRGFPADIAQWRDYRSIPDEFQELGRLLAERGEEPPVLPEAVDYPDLDDAGARPEKLQFRDQFYAVWEDRAFVVTRRKALGPADVPTSPANRFLRRSIPNLAAIRQRIEALAQPPEPRFPHQAVRVYTLCEDGMLTILPIPPAGADAETQRAVTLREGKELRKLPKLPNFVSNEFFFVFDFDETRPARPFFSGLYLDLGGQGLIATLTAPFAAPEGGLDGVLGVDVAFSLDWADFAANIEKPLVVELATLAARPQASGWQPWRALRDVGQRQNPRLQRALARLARSESEERRFHNPSPIYHGVAGEEGALVAFQVNLDTWMIILFPQTPPAFPVISVVFLAALFILLLAGFEWNRQEAQRARRKAVGEFEEKQSLLDAMQAPLMVIDPNTEKVVYGNRAALQLGIGPGKVFKELLGGDPEATAHYERMQMTDDPNRRAYGLPLRVGGETRYAVIRSVAVQAPIGMIHADERHRLGMIFFIEPDADLALYTRGLLQRAQDEERARLASLLDHGVDTLARVLCRRLERYGHSDFTQWLSRYIQRRIRVSAWVLSHWDVKSPLPPDCVIEAAHARATLARLEQVFRIVRDDPELRAQLHWNNGVLAAPLSPGPDGAETPAMAVEMAWPEDFCFTCPIAGGFGLFLGEVLINAVRHGEPGSQPSLTVALAPVRRELVFRAVNRVVDAEDSPTAKKYGGRAMLVRLADLFQWRGLAFERRDGVFTVSWRIPASERAHDRDSD